MSNTERIIKQLVTEKVPFFLILNKIDRLILELNLPPQDAYFKLKHVVEQVNTVLKKYGVEQRLSPEADNVCFASTKQGWIFSLKSFAKMYCQRSNTAFDHVSFARRLWGDIYFDREKRLFRKTPLEGQTCRSFTEFILEPLYKIMAHTISQEKKNLKPVLASLGIYLKNSSFGKNMWPLLKEVFQKFFGTMSGFVDMCVLQIPSPLQGTAIKCDHTYTGDSGKYTNAMKICDPNGPLMIQIVKIYNVEDVTKFDCFGRILSGTVKVGEQVRVLGPDYTPEDEEDMATKVIESIALYQTRYRIPLDSAQAGMLVLISGIDASITKTATITDMNEDEGDPVHIFRPLKYETIPVMKVSIEPANPTELPRMLDGLRKVSKTYSILETRVEESGEHVIVGVGELYLDSVLHDLRQLYAEIDLKVSDPVVKLCETIVEVSQVKCHAMTPNGHNKLTMIAEPLEKGIAEDIELERVKLDNPKQAAEFFQKKYEWDLLASRGIWAFGPDNQGPNMLVNDTLPGEVQSINDRLIENCLDLFGIRLCKGFNGVCERGR
jgi:U5 small nuclear ribonucleoprotein component